MALSHSKSQKEYRSMGANKKGTPSKMMTKVLLSSLALFVLTSSTLTLNVYAFAAPTHSHGVRHGGMQMAPAKKTRLELFPQSTNTNVVGNKVKPIRVAAMDYSPGVPVENRMLITGFHFVADRLPGIATTALLAHAATLLSRYPMLGSVSPLLWATILGMAVGNLSDYHSSSSKSSTQTLLSNGIKYSKARLLRLGIILYGFKITLQQIAGIGWTGLLLDAFVVTTTLTLGIQLGTSRLFQMDRATSTLIGSGSAICGCSAVLATQPIVDAEPHQVSAAVATVVLGGTASMFLYPILFKSLSFLASPKVMGVFTGATMHEIAGVVGAGTAMGPDVASIALVTKLARVLLLAPVLTALSWLRSRREDDCQTASSPKCKITLPWFAFSFVAVSALNSSVSFPSAFVQMASKASAFFLLCAMAGLGMDSNFQEIRRLGPRPMLLAGVLWAWLVGGGLFMARFVL